MFETDPNAFEGFPPAGLSGDLTGPRAQRHLAPDFAGHDHDYELEAIEAHTETAVQLACLENAVRLQWVRELAVLDHAKAWRRDGQTCLANWIVLQFGVGRRTAREIALVAQKIEELPALATAFGEGRLSWDQFVPLCELATPETDAAWADDGAGHAAEDLHKMVKSRRLTTERARDIHERRAVIARTHRSGGTELRCLLENSNAEAVLVELDRIREEEAVPDPETGSYPSVAQQRADALVSLAHRGLGADGDVDRATIVLHGDIAALEGDDHAHCALPDGTPIAADTLRRYACDARIEIAVDGPHGVTLGIGRASRTWPAWMVRQITQRDGGRCRFPGCPNRIHHIHHSAEWVADKGRTDTDNGAGYCWSHHHLLHEGHWTVTGHADHTLTYTSPDGRTVLQSPVRKLSPEVKHRMRGVAPGLFEND